MLYGEITDPLGDPVPQALVIVTDMTGKQNGYAWGVDGSYEYDLREVGAAAGDEMNVVATNGICVANATFVYDGEAYRLDFVLDPKPVGPPGQPKAGNGNAPSFEDVEPPQAGEGDAAEMSIENSPGFGTMIDYAAELEDLPDLFPVKLKASDASPYAGDTVELIVEFGVEGPPVNNVAIAFYLDDVDAQNLIGMGMASLLDATVSVQWDTAGVEGEHTVIAVVDPDDEVEEMWEDNNRASIQIEILTPGYLIGEAVAEAGSMTAFWLEKARGDHAAGRLGQAVVDLHLAADNTEYLDLEMTIIDAARLVVGGEDAEDVASVLAVVAGIMAENDFGAPTGELIANAYQHFWKAMEALAKELDPWAEIEHGYEKLEMALADVEGEAMEEIENAMLVFPPDLEISNKDVYMTGEFYKDLPQTITINVENVGKVRARDVKVRIYDRLREWGETIKDVLGKDGALINEVDLPMMQCGEETMLSLEWIPDRAGTHIVTVEVVSGNREAEMNNNLAVYGCHMVGGTLLWDTPEERTITNYTEVYDEWIRVIGGDLVVQPGGKLVLVNTTLRVECPEGEGGGGAYSILVEEGGAFEVRESAKITGLGFLLGSSFIVHGSLTINGGA